MGAKVTSKGQITIPKWVREALGLHSGTRVEFVLDNGFARLLAVKPQTARDLAGSLKAYARNRGTLSEHALMEKVRDEVAHAAANVGRPARHQRHH